MRSQVWDQLGPLGIWPHVSAVEVDGRAIRSKFIQRVGTAPLQEQQEEALEALRAEYQRGAQEEDADTDAVWAGTSAPGRVRMHSRCSS